MQVLLSSPRKGSLFMYSSKKVYPLKIIRPKKCKFGVEDIEPPLLDIDEVNRLAKQM